MINTLLRSLITKITENQLKSIFLYPGRIRVSLGMREHWVNSDLKGVIEHCRDDPRKMNSARIKAGICVHLDKPYFEVGIDHEVVTEYLKTVTAPF
jgi:hypothetical protein